MAANRKFLTDAQLAKITPLLPSEKPGSKGARPSAPNREVLEGILWMLHWGTLAGPAPAIPQPLYLLTSLKTLG
jgi:Putative transposase of IS4/5 family (DUF4096)